MSYKDRLRQASWRGVEFQPISASFTLGRHVVVHEFPLRDEPFAEDMARKARAITVEGRLLGDDYDLARNKLIAAIEKQGEGTLVLPTFGRVVMQLDTGSVDESYISEGGQATFSLQLGEAGSRSFPEIESQPATTIETRAADLQAATNDSFDARFDTEGYPDWVVASAQQLFFESFDLIEGGLGIVDGAQGARMDDTWTVAEETAISAAASEFYAAVVLNAFDGVAEATQGYVGELQRWKTYVTAMTFFVDNPSASDIGSSSWDQDVVNRYAIIRLMRRACLAAMAVAATTDLEFESRDEAEQIQDLVVGYYDRELAEDDVNDDGELFASMYLARLAFINWIEAVALDLVPLRDYTPVAVKPVLVIAQELYGDATRAEEIIERNAIEHPLFVRGGQTLKVLVE
jgi:prophage DNA circulation protein